MPQLPISRSGLCYLFLEKKPAAQQEKGYLEQTLNGFAVGSFIRQQPVHAVSSRNSRQRAGGGRRRPGYHMLLVVVSQVPMQSPLLFDLSVTCARFVEDSFENWIQLGCRNTTLTIMFVRLYAVGNDPRASVQPPISVKSNRINRG